MCGCKGQESRLVEMKPSLKFVNLCVCVCVCVHIYIYGLKSARGHISPATKGTLMSIWLNDKSLTYAQLRVFCLFAVMVNKTRSVHIRKVTLRRVRATIVVWKINNYYIF